MIYWAYALLHVHYKIATTKHTTKLNIKKAHPYFHLIIIWGTLICVLDCFRFDYLP